VRFVSAILGFAVILVVLWDAFETVVLPRRVTRRFRLTRAFYRATWFPWRAAACALVPRKTRESFLGLYGPLSLLFLLSVWAVGLIFGFALLHHGAGSAVNLAGEEATFRLDLYLSGTTFFTLGLGDVTPRNSLARFLTILESGMGFGFLALVISYLPVLYQSFSRRELNIALLDARAGSPPTPAELLRRHASPRGFEALERLLRDFERWAAELLESHISYPVLGYFRSQHANQSWLAALAVLLDTCALVIVGVEGACARQAQLTFAIARHVVVDLAQVFNAPPAAPPQDRLSAAGFAALRKELASAGLPLPDDPGFEEKLRKLRGLYEPYVHSLSEHLRVAIPPWIAPAKSPDNWQTSAWGRISGFDVGEDKDFGPDDHI
jgi:hypothetical protein